MQKSVENRIVGVRRWPNASATAVGGKSVEKSPDGGMVMEAQGEAALVLLGQRGSRPARPPAKQARVRVCMCCTSAPAKKSSTPPSYTIRD